MSSFTPRTVEQIAEQAKLSGLHKTALEQQISIMQSHLALRETAKHYLMLGYALIRRHLQEIGQRFELGDDTYFLTPEELPRLTTGEDLHSLIQERKQRRELTLSLDVPSVIFSDNLEVIGRPPVMEGGAELQGIALSLGSAEGPALVLEHPSIDAIPSEPYVLVCPSTDPAWVPLFARAKALVMETGGVLSHGAIVAREFGLPAVAGIPNVHRQLKTGQRVHVDGSSGKIHVRESDG